jgi:signal transduction histidine kinase
MKQPSSIIAHEDLARLAFRSAGDALVVLDGAGHILEVNAAAHQELALPPEQLIGQPLPPNISKDRLRTQAADENHRLVRIIPEIEIADRKQAENALQEAQRLESLSVLAGGVAHTFNNLLTTILGYASLASNEPGLGPDVQACLQQIEYASRQAADVCRRLLAHAGRGQTMIEPIDVNTSIRHHAAIMQLSLPANVTLTLELDGSSPRTQGDAGQLDSVIVCLLTNAREALEGQAGQILVQTAIESLGQARLSGMRLGPGLPEGTYLLLEVRDSGCGMDEGTRSRCFEPFFTTKFTGRGLGLSALHGIVRAHQGALEVESCPGQGTTFRLYFPALEPQPSPPPRSSAIADSGLGEGKILVADDEEGVRGIACKVLEMLGLTTLQAADGLEVLAVLERQRAEVRLLLLDLTMPRLDGRETLAAVYQRWPDLPVILMSGHGECEVGEWFACNGPTNFLQKPFTHRELEVVLRKQLHE